MRTMAECLHAITDTGAAAVTRALAAKEAERIFKDKPDLYSYAVASEMAMDNHESDLYLKASPEAVALVRVSGFSHSFFTSQIDGEAWIDVPFAFYPWWAARGAK